jgi:hypothetical protein
MESHQIGLVRPRPPRQSPELAVGKRKLVRFLSPIIILSACLLGAGTASAASVGGHITYVQAYPTGQYSFRIVLDTPLTGCTGNFIYVDTTYSNYQAFVATALTAYSLGKVVGLDYNTGTYCSANGIVVQP